MMEYPMYGSPRPTYLPQQQQPIYQQPPAYQPPGFACRPVTSREEAIAMQIDFASPGTLMPDFAHGVIYFKRFNSNTGASDFLTYALRTEPQRAEWASAQEVVELRERLQQLTERLNRMEVPRDESGE